MKTCALAVILLLPCFALGQSSPPPVIDETVPPASDSYPLGPDSQPNPSVTAGKTFSFQQTDSGIFPGTTRTITVYVPAGYKGDKPACVYVGLDGLGFNAATVFDNLIAQHAMPITIGIGVSPGSVASANAPENPRFDRSFEFDSLSNRLARFVIEEVIPQVEQHKTPDGQTIMLSSNPDDRAIGGGSTGAIAAFTVAWERPDAFRRVFSAIGTYVGMRGGEQYYVLVRKTEPKPLRIFMQDGVHDEWPGGPEMGDWWMSNQTMNRALEFAGYDVRHVWGAGTHNGLQASVLGQGLNIRNLTVRDNGDIYAVTSTENSHNELWLIRANAEKIRLDQDLKGASGVALSPDGLWLFVSQSHSRAGLSYRVHPDGTLDARGEFYDFYVPGWADDSGAGQIAMDRDGRAYVATRVGVQVFDRNGRVAAILPLPGNWAADSVCFGGHDFDTLYVASGGQVYRRKLHIAGAPPWATPAKLPPWGAG